MWSQQIFYDMLNFMFRGEKWQLSAVKLCFVMNVLNNKTIILLNLGDYSSDFSQLGLTASSAKYEAG